MSNSDFVDFPRLYGTPLMCPEQVSSLLRDPQKHWKKGRSAYETAHAWFGAGKAPGGGIPPGPKAVLAQAEEWRPASIVIGLFEHATALDTQVGPSNTDVLVVCKLDHGLGILAVEGKAGEDFGQVVGIWNKSKGTNARLSWACKMFGVEAPDCATLRWQLFHRTACAVIEAKRFDARNAIMIVHDFSNEPKRDHFEDYEQFASLAKFVGARRNAITEPRMIDGVSLRLAWVSDKPRIG